MRFSIVIPTKNRAECLPAAIASCLCQNHDSFEVIVSDNCNDGDTALAVKKFDDCRLRYVRSDRALSMVDHWEFAIGHAQGEFVLVLGDDDALLKHALFEIDLLLLATGTEVIRWEWAYYGWPRGPLFDGGCDFYCDIPERVCEQRSGLSAIEGLAARVPPSYAHLPMLYNAAVSSRVITAIKSKAGRFFCSTNPDICSGIAVASFCKSYWTSKLPMSIAGLSPKSNGLQNLHGDGLGATAKDFWRALEDSAVRWQDDVPKVRGSLAMSILDALTGARKAGLLHPASGVDSRFFISACIREMSAKSAEARSSAVDTVRCFLEKRRPAELLWFDSIVSDFGPEVPATKVAPACGASDLNLKLGIDDTIMRQRLVDFGVSDSAEAAGWYEKTFRCAECPREWKIVPLERSSGADRGSVFERGLRRFRRAGRVLLTGR